MLIKAKSISSSSSLGTNQSSAREFLLLGEPIHFTLKSNWVDKIAQDYLHLELVDRKRTERTTQVIRDLLIGAMPWQLCALELNAVIPYIFIFPHTCGLVTIPWFLERLKLNLYYGKEHWLVVCIWRTCIVALNLQTGKNQFYVKCGPWTFSLAEFYVNL